MSEQCQVCGQNKQEAPTVMCAPCALWLEQGKVVRVYKAQPVGQGSVPDLRIVATDTWPSDPGIDPDWLHREGERHDAKASDIESALHASLPGGTYDRLLTKMLQRKASVFVVSNASVFDGKDK